MKPGLLGDHSGALSKRLKTRRCPRLVTVFTKLGLPEEQRLSAHPALAACVASVTGRLKGTFCPHATGFLEDKPYRAECYKGVK